MAKGDIKRYPNGEPIDTSLKRVSIGLGLLVVLIVASYVHYRSEEVFHLVVLIALNAAAFSAFVCFLLNIRRRPRVALRCLSLAILAFVGVMLLMSP